MIKQLRGIRKFFITISCAIYFPIFSCLAMTNFWNSFSVLGNNYSVTRSIQEEAGWNESGREKGVGERWRKSALLEEKLRKRKLLKFSESAEAKWKRDCWGGGECKGYVIHQTHDVTKQVKGGNQSGGGHRKGGTRHYVNLHSGCCG